MCAEISTAASGNYCILYYSVVLNLMYKLQLVNKLTVVSWVCWSSIEAICNTIAYLITVLDLITLWLIYIVIKSYVYYSQGYYSAIDSLYPTQSTTITKCKLYYV